MRSLVIGCVVVGVALASLRTPTPSRPDDSCKPEAPFVIEIAATPAMGEQVDLGWSVAPRRAVRQLAWTLVPSDGVALVQGEPAGTLAEAVAGEPLERAARLIVPQDGAHRWVRLEITAVIQGSDETGAVFDEPVSMTRTLEWNRPAAPVPTVLSPDAETGALVEVAVVPAAHIPGGAP